MTDDERPAGTGELHLTGLELGEDGALRVVPGFPKPEKAAVAVERRCFVSKRGDVIVTDNAVDGSFSRPVCTIPAAAMKFAVQAVRVNKPAGRVFPVGPA